MDREQRHSHPTLRTGQTDHGESPTFFVEGDGVDGSRINSGKSLEEIIEEQDESIAQCLELAMSEWGMDFTRIIENWTWRQLLLMLRKAGERGEKQSQDPAERENVVDDDSVVSKHLDPDTEVDDSGSSTLDHLKAILPSGSFHYATDH